MNHFASEPTRARQITHLFAWLVGAVALGGLNVPTFAGMSGELRLNGSMGGESVTSHVSREAGAEQSDPKDKNPGVPASPTPKIGDGKKPDDGAKNQDAVKPPPPPPPPPSPSPASFLLESGKHPHVKISWPCRDKTMNTLEADLEYQAPKQSVPIGKNLSAYVALGGTRGDLGLGSPGAVDVRVGFYKLDKKKPMFDGLADDAAITVEFTGITFNQPGKAKPVTALQHLKFEGNTTVLGCAGDPGVLATYNTLDASQTIGGLVTRKNGRLGVLSQKTGSVQASVTFTTDPKGAVGMKAVVPYAIFKHADDPWLRTNPGDFTEPVHFHIEFECEPVDKPTRDVKQTPKQES